MSEEKKEKSFAELNESVPEPKKTSFKSKVINLLTWRFRMLAAIFGYDEKDLTSSSSRGRENKGYQNSGTTVPPRSAERDFRGQYSFDPEKVYIERIRERAYNQLVDGRGDPEPHDCDHDHEH